MVSTLDYPESRQRLGNARLQLDGMAISSPSAVSSGDGLIKNRHSIHYADLMVDRR